ncbi:ComF family protein [Asticcacaulis sp. AC402]|uniref:ComF family protein n=1 Tax=Asticcacaulis sp. AC402 TaxID=1282361 RepID=UPI0003C3ED9A|nr:ComF family protein [Asticcacaulis sp. AC402]ESQ77139.1 hypothetical protein ABAC402_01705 [Asticcacaulis sp. AC402]
MRKLSSYVGQIASEVKAFGEDHLSWAYLRGAAGQMIDMVFPPHGQGEATEDSGTGGVGMEAGRWSRIRFLDRDGCDMCARPFEGGLHLGAGGRCTVCEDDPFPFVRTRAACLYSEASKGVILGFKHGDRLDAAPMLTRWLERAATDVLSETDLVVPVPLHPLRLLERRYNQAAELARPLARRFGKTYLPDGLKRVEMTKAQGHASAQMRWDNVRKAFAVSPTGANVIAGKRVVLIDDVFTTGATLKACTRELLKAGAAQVDIAVLARAVQERA